MRKRRGPRHEPCNTPTSISSRPKETPLPLQHCLRFDTEAIYFGFALWFFGIAFRRDIWVIIWIKLIIQSSLTIFEIMIFLCRLSLETLFGSNSPKSHRKEKRGMNVLFPKPPILVPFYFWFILFSRHQPTWNIEPEHAFQGDQIFVDHIFIWCYLMKNINQNYAAHLIAVLIIESIAALFE